MRTLAALLAAVVVAAIARADDPSPQAVRAAVEKALPRIEAGVTNYPKNRQCFSCHHQAMAVLSLTKARQHGFAVETELVKKVVDFSLRSFRNRSLISQGRGVGGDSTSVVYILHTLAAADQPRDETTAALVEYLLARQRRDGSWAIPADRPPTMSSIFTNNALALFALKQYGPAPDDAKAEELQKRIDAAFARGRDWLLVNNPVTTEDRVFHLRGLVYAGVEGSAVQDAREHLLKDQRADGSWAQLPTLSGDAYATATALVALRQAGLDVDHEAYRKGVKYLLDTQREDGAWVVPTRSRPLQPFFDNGDAGGKSQFISFAATGWAVLALLEACPGTP